MIKVGVVGAMGKMGQEVPVKIYTWADKEPSFIYKQYETIKKNAFYNV